MSPDYISAIRATPLNTPPSFVSIDRARRRPRRAVRYELVLSPAGRLHLEAGAAQAPPGLLRGLADEHLAAALRRMHEKPADSWTVAQLAKDLLRHADLTVAEVAERVGYGSPSSFSVAFGRHVGQAPTYYARAVNHRDGISRSH